MKLTKEKIILFFIVIIFIIVGVIVMHDIKQKIYSRNIIAAIEQKNYTKLSELLDKKGNVDALPFNNFYALITEKFNEPPLFYACRKGDVESVEMLLNHGANTNITTNNYTPLMATAESLNVERFKIANLLIDNSAEINYVDKWGKTAVLYFANGYNRNDNYEDGYNLFIKMVSMKVIPGKDLEFYYGNYLLYAVSTNNVRIVDYLIENLNYDINSVGRDGVTTLIRATQYNAIDVVRYLIENGVDVNAKDNNNKTAYDYAKDKNNIEIISLLEN